MEKKQILIMILFFCHNNYMAIKVPKQTIELTEEQRQARRIDTRQTIIPETNYEDRTKKDYDDKKYTTHLGLLLDELARKDRITEEMHGLKQEKLKKQLTLLEEMGKEIKKEREWLEWVTTQYKTNREKENLLRLPAGAGKGEA